MEYTNMRLPAALWERLKKHAQTLNKSTVQTGVECIEDALDEMDAKTPSVPRIVQIYHFLK